MRLIDADKLIEPGYTDMFDEPIRFDMVSRYAIETAPTVEAIPIEWIRNYVSIWISEPYKNFALNMIKTWEKENEHKESD